MGYNYSTLDKRLAKWFKEDKTCATLHQIKLRGKIRGLHNINVELDFPISAFAGKNGCGKTTILALAACGYHNDNKGFKIPTKKRNYYTFSDFFIQTQEEIKHNGISIWYRFLHDNWIGVEPGLAFQKMTKGKGGKWSKYDTRIEKNVLYLGIERVVPQSEKRVYKSYVKYFKDGIDDGWYQDVQKQVGRILNKNYTEFKIKKAASYKMQMVKETGVIYSGFNMGAGEKALFELFSIIHECSKSGKPTLIIIDEIELGLHELAQRKLISVLKEICQNHRVQIICTTHAPAILESLPPEARFYVDKNEEGTVISKGISGDFASGKLAGKNSNELDIYVEDVIGVTLLNASFDLELRQRVGVMPVGSYSAVCRQLAAAYRHPALRDKTIAIIDGDQRSRLNEFINKMMADLELSTALDKSKFKEWIKDKIFFLPGPMNPEKWIIQMACDKVDRILASYFGLKVSLLKKELELALEEPTHSEFFYLSEKLSLSEDSILNTLSKFVALNGETELNEIRKIIEEILG